MFLCRLCSAEIVIEREGRSIHPCSWLPWMCLRGTVVSMGDNFVKRAVAVVSTGIAIVISVILA